MLNSMDENYFQKFFLCIKTGILLNRRGTSFFLFISLKFIFLQNRKISIYWSGASWAPVVVTIARFSDILTFFNGPISKVFAWLDSY